MSSVHAIWHEVECGGYEADLETWVGLARRFDGRVLDVGAGTGRVSLRVARLGRSVVALDTDAELLSELRRKGSCLEEGDLATVCGDAREFVDESGFGLVIVAMQTVQLFGGAAQRARFMRCARRNTTAGGCLAIAVADMTQTVPDGRATFEADVLVAEGEHYSSRPVSVLRQGGEVVIERERVHTAGTGTIVRSVSREAIDLVDSATIQDEGMAAGFVGTSVEFVPPTGSYAGAEVVLLHG